MLTEREFTAAAEQYLDMAYRLALSACGPSPSAEGTEPIPPEASAALNGDTVATASADPKNSKTLYLWEEGNVPAVTEYTRNNGDYFDAPDFRPYLGSFPVPEGTPDRKSVV